MAEVLNVYFAPHMPTWGHTFPGGTLVEHDDEQGRLRLHDPSSGALGAGRWIAEFKSPHWTHWVREPAAAADPDQFEALPGDGA